MIDRFRLRLRWRWWPVCLLAAACSAPQAGLVDGVLHLPKALREVSGMVLADERTLACIQDEIGSLFFVDLRGEHPVREAPFGPPGDYEGLAKVGDDYWVLRSDGLLLQIVQSARGWAIQASHRLVLAHREYEGLCFDAQRRVLLILPKDLANEGQEARSQVGVQVFDLATGTFAPEPRLVLRRSVVQSQLEQFSVVLPPRVTNKGKERPGLKLHCSELHTVPGSDDLLILSAVDHLLVRIGPDGTVRGARQLDPELLPQPESMCFLGDGRLLVGSEGRKGRAVARIVDLP